MRSLLLSLELLKVEFEFSSLKNVAVCAATLARSGGDGSEQSSGVELVGNVLINNSCRGSPLYLGDDVARLLLSLSLSLGSLLHLLLSQFHIVVLLVVGLERSGINLDDCVLDDRLGSHKLVVGCIVDNIKNTRFLGSLLRSPVEVSGVKEESSGFVVSSSASHDNGTFGSQFCLGGLSAHLELPLLLVDRHTPTGGPTLVPRIPRDTHLILNNNTPQSENKSKWRSLLSS